MNEDRELRSGEQTLDILPEQTCLMKPLNVQNKDFDQIQTISNKNQYTLVKSTQNDTIHANLWSDGHKIALESVLLSNFTFLTAP